MITGYLSATNYITAKSYQRGLKHGFWAKVLVCGVVGYLCFTGGRTYEYVQTINAAAEAQMKQTGYGSTLKKDK